MAMLALDQRPLDRVAGPDSAKPPTPEAPPPATTEPDDDVFQRWLQAQPWPRRWFARFYRALRKLQPMFPPMSCC